MDRWFLGNHSLFNETVPFVKIIVKGNDNWSANNHVASKMNY